MNNLFYFLNFVVAGVVSHSLDWRKSAGGFIHGYRYTGIYLEIVLFSGPVKVLLV